MSVAKDNKLVDKDGPPKKRGRPPKDPNAPKPKRGRPPKTSAVQNNVRPDESHPFAGASSVAAVAVPVAAEEVDAIVEEVAGQVDVQPEVAVEPTEVVDQVVQPPPPDRATFAGRTRVGSTDFQGHWDARREIYYKRVPKEFWKDHLERQYWSLCTSTGDNDKAMDQFLEDKGAPKPAAAKAQAKSKARKTAPGPSKKPSAKTPGRGRGRGIRGNKGNWKLACR